MVDEIVVPLSGPKPALLVFNQPTAEHLAETLEMVTAASRMVEARMLYIL